MPMVQIGIVRMLVSQRLVLVPMRLRLRDRTVVIVLVMLIVNVSVLVRQNFVKVLVFVSFREVQPEA